MSLRRYTCIHCSHQFEHEDQDSIECPKCYWSSSVKPAEEVQELSRSSTVSLDKGVAPFSGNRMPLVTMKSFAVLFKILIGISIAAGVFYFLWIYGKPRLVTRSEQRQVPLLIEASKGKQKAAVRDLKPEQPLTPEELDFLNTSIETDKLLSLSEEEEAILKKRVRFETGLNETLPSPIWTLEQFKQMVEQQELFYKIPLPRSYQKKLEQLFQTHYLEGQKSFGQGNLKEARDFWIQSLAFPVYGSDIQKHRGVVLTMLRPFINDTLSKIGALNQTLLAYQLRQQEIHLHEAYVKITPLLESQSWETALQRIDEMIRLVDNFEKQNLTQLRPPLYPDSIRQVDQGIQAALYDLLEAGQVARADVGVLKTDLEEKRAVILGRVPKIFEENSQFYQQGIRSIRQSHWSHAAQALQKVSAPETLRKDARKKIVLIQKIRESSS